MTKILAEFTTYFLSNGCFDRAITVVLKPAHSQFFIFFNFWQAITSFLLLVSPQNLQDS